MSKNTKQEQPKVEQKPEDKGCGGVTLMLDHSTGTISAGVIGNITTRELREVTRMYLKLVENTLDNEAVAAQEQLEALLREQMPAPTGPPPVV